MSFVEHDWISQFDRTLVIRLRLGNREDLARACASAPEPFDEIAAGDAPGKCEVAHRRAILRRDWLGDGNLDQPERLLMGKFSLQQRHCDGVDECITLRTS